MGSELFPTGTARFSPDEVYRYTLTRTTDRSEGPHVAIVMLNPSTADADRDDPTIRRVRTFCERFMPRSLVVLNVFALRSTDPGPLSDVEDPVGPENDQTIREEVTAADVVVVAWGANGDRFPDRIRTVTEMLPDGTLCLGVTSSGQPRHPLYLRGDTEFRPWTGIRGD